MAFHEGPPARRRWPVLFITIGFAMLAWFTFFVPQAQNYLEQTVWWVSAAVVAGVSFAFLCFGTSDLRRISAACIVAYSALRGVASVNDDTYTPVGVWMIIIGLTVAAYKSQVRVEAQENA